MSSFFTLPASQRKRKRTDQATRLAKAPRRNERRDDESISGSDISGDDEPAPVVEGESEDEDEDFEDEDPSAKRRRLAEQYLSNVEKEVLQDEGFDAADVDQENLRRRMGDRLKEDTAESKGKLYRRIADGLDWTRAEGNALRCQSMHKSFTGIAMCGRHVYAVTKDLRVFKIEVPESTLPVKGKRVSKRLKIVAHTRGYRKNKHAQHHHEPILCVAASPDGKFVATGGADNKLIVWDAETLKPLKVFTHHRDSVTALAFRRGTNQLFSASKDRTVKIWSLNELAYVETLFGHQDEILDVSALAEEKCVTVGARDRTARLWKVVEESQLVFRGGGAPGTSKALEKLKRAYEDDSETTKDATVAYHEGSTDRVTMIDDETFITASDNGSLSLWNIHKKKAVFTQPLAHGLDPALTIAEASAEQHPDQDLDEKSRGGKQPRWITALKAIPFSDIFVTGSWDGYIRAWKISEDKRRIESLGAVNALPDSVEDLLEKEGLSSESLSNVALEAMKSGAAKQQKPINGIINDIAIVDKGERGKDGIMIAVAVGKEHRLGRWKRTLDGRDRVLLFQVPKKGTDSGLDGQSVEGDEMDGDDFEGFE